MPELPEVEKFRELLLPLVSTTPQSITVESHANNNNKRIELTGEDIQLISTTRCTDVIRKGKQLCIVLLNTKEETNYYLFLHMGMTGHIRVPGVAVNWGGKKVTGEDVPTELSKLQDEKEEEPPKFVQLVFRCGSYTAYFCDPRKFGSCTLMRDRSPLDSLAPDAFLCKDTATIQSHILPKLTQQRLGIKAILLDQKRAVSGVGNWVADEVLYQCHMHPDQTCLTKEEADRVWETLQSIVTAAVDSLRQNTHYPETWLFNYRWTKKKKQVSKDAEGRTITFITAGGRTSAIISSLQKFDSSRKRRAVNPAKGKTKREKSTEQQQASEEEAQAHEEEILHPATREEKRKSLQRFRHVDSSPTKLESFKRRRTSKRLAKQDTSS